MRELNGKPVSELGWKAAKALDMIFSGLHNVPHTIGSRKAFDLTRSDYIGVIVSDGGFSSFDFDRLTRAVIAAHLFQVRIEVNPHGRGYFLIRFHNREADGPMWARHPNTSALKAMIDELSGKHPYAPGAEGEVIA